MEQSVSARALPTIRNLLKHQFAIILVAVAVALGVAGLYIANSPARYTSSAVLLLSPAPGNPLTAEAASSSAVQMTVALETEAQLAQTPAVARLVTESLGRDVPDDKERLSVAVPSNTQMLEVTFTSSTPERAKEGAQGFAEGYLEYRAERASTVQQNRVDALSAQITETDENLRRAVAEAAAAGAPTYASQEVQLFADRLAQLSNSRSAAEAVSTAPGSVVSAATLPESANGLPTWVMLLVAAVLGLAAGVALALLREWRRDVLRESDGATEAGLPVLATVQSASNTLVETDDHAHESYRQLRTAVIANGPRPHVLAVTGLGEDSSATVAANLAVVLAEAQFSVLLVATDARHHAVERYVGVSVGPGLAEAVLDGSAVLDLVREAHGISVLTAGVDGSRDITASPGFRSMIDSLRQQFDYVLLATSAAGSADGDAALLAADSGLFVLTPDATSRTLIGSTLERLDRLGVKAMGAVWEVRANGRTRGVTAEPSEPEVSADASDAAREPTRAIG